MFRLLLSLCIRPRGATQRTLRWLLCALVPAWLCWSASWAGAATRELAASVAQSVALSAIASPEESSSESAASAAPEAELPEAVSPAAVLPEAVPSELREEGAPMCDPHGASVAALPEVPEVDHGKLEQLPCDDAWRLWLGNTLEQARGQAAARNGVPAAPPLELQVERTRLDGVLPIVIVMPGRQQPVQLPPSEVAGLPARPGHRLSIYRPPVRGR